MKGIVLCGGYGTRLYPLTEVLNKHGLPVYNKQMMCYPLKTLKGMGITDIQVVLGGENIDAFIRFLKDGTQFGLKFSYVYQREAGGIAQAIGLCEDFVGKEKFVVILGDNLFLSSLREFREEFERGNADCGLIVTKVNHPENYGVPKFKNNKIVEVIEKPFDSPSPFAVTGIYAFSSKIFPILKKLHPSKRNELEISDAITLLLNESGKDIFWKEFEGKWLDCGESIDSLLAAGLIVKENITHK